MNKKRIFLNKFIIPITIFLVIILLVNTFTDNKLLNGMYQSFKKITAPKVSDIMSYIVYDNQKYFDEDSNTNRN